MVEAPARLAGLPPIVDARTVVLILGSFPSEQSLARQQYYGHPRNHFWPVLEAVLGVSAQLPYEQRVSGLLARRVGIWDVIGGCEREGSADAAIKGAEANDLARLVGDQADIRYVAFNGQTAAATARRLAPGLFSAGRVECHEFPSTSPAYAIPLAAKARAWEVLRYWVTA